VLMPTLESDRRDDGAAVAIVLVLLLHALQTPPPPPRPLSLSLSLSLFSGLVSVSLLARPSLSRRFSVSGLVLVSPDSSLSFPTLLSVSVSNKAHGRMLNKLCIPKEHGSRLHFYGLLFRNCNSSIELTVGHPHRDDQFSYKMENPEERPWLPNRERKEGVAIVDADPEERPQICRNNKYAI
jgi:hypothetical protein